MTRDTLPSLRLSPTRWDYVAAFDAKCATWEHFTDASCAASALAAARADSDLVDACVADAGGVGSGDGPNHMLEAEAALRQVRMRSIDRSFDRSIV